MAKRFIVHKRNPLNIPIGTQFELTEFGYEQIIIAKSKSANRYEAAGYTGMIYPASSLYEYVLQIKNEGVDDNALRPQLHKRSYTYSE